MYEYYKDIYSTLTLNIYMIGLMATLAAGVLTWWRRGYRARVYAQLCRPAFRFLWLILILSGVGAVLTALTGGDARTFFIAAALSVVLGMALFPAALVLFRESGFGDAPMLKLIAASHRPGVLDERAHRRGAILRRMGRRGYPIWEVAAWSIAALVFTIVYSNLVEIYVKPELAPEFKDLYQDQNLSPVLVFGVLLSSAVIEEVQFRLLGLGLVTWLFRARTGKQRDGLAIIIVALVWALGHSNIILLPGFKEIHIFVLGLIYGVMAKRYGAEAPIIAHLLNNFVAGFAVLVPGG